MPENTARQLATELVRLDAAIVDTRRLLWNASQMRRAAGVFAMTAELDRLIDARLAVKRQLRTLDLALLDEVDAVTIGCANSAGRLF